MPRGYVDLQMRFAALDSGVDVVVWVEIKHGAPLSAEQLPTYREALRRRHKPAGRAGAIVLLDSVTRLPHERAPPEVPQRSWERTGISIRQFKDQYVTDPVERWLCDELLAYLQEEHITYPDALGPEHLTALAYIREAEHALKAICTEAQARIPEVIAGKPFRLSQDDPPPYKRANAWVEFIIRLTELEDDDGAADSRIAERGRVATEPGVRSDWSARPRRAGAMHTDDRLPVRDLMVPALRIETRLLNRRPPSTVRTMSLSSRTLHLSDAS